MTTNDITPARAGRERNCTHCGATYRSPRSSSLYCSTSCRQKTSRGTAPKSGPKCGPAGWNPITKALHLAGYIGCIGPVSTNSKAPAVYGLTVPHQHALDELSFQFNRRGWGHISRAEFDDALRSDGIKGYLERSDKAVDSKLWQDRQRQRLNRSA